MNTMPAPPRRAWSLIITFFGDSIMLRGGAVSAATVSTVMEACGHEPGAVRTAFSRLTRDGWVSRERQGRRSYYRLAEQGRVPFEEASARIYAAPAAPEPFYAALTAGAGLLFTGDPRTLPPDALPIPEPSAGWPLWLHDETTIAAIDGLAAEPERPGTDLEALAHRTLLVHDWRRLVLRVSSGPTPDSRAVERLRPTVAERYGRLLPASERWLNRHALGPRGALPSPDPDFEKRYTNS